MDERAVVAFCADARYVVPLAVALRSLARSTAPSTRFDVLVLSAGIPHDQHAALRSAARPLDVRFVDLTGGLPTDLPTPHHFTSAIYGRLWLVDHLPAATTRAVYLDTDVLVRHDLGPLLTAPVSSAGVAAVPDVGIPHVSSPAGIAQWRALGLDPTTPYCNSGVLVIDPERWRENATTDRVVEHLRRAPTAALGDQEGLNAVLRGDFAPLPLRWNQLDPLRRSNHLAYSFFPRAEVDEAIHDPAIVHLTSTPKPWQSGCTDPAAPQWWALLAETDHHAYRVPSPSSRERAVLALGRAARRVASR